MKRNVHLGWKSGAQEAYCGAVDPNWTISIATYNEAPLFPLPKERWCPCCVVVVQVTKVEP